MNATVAQDAAKQDRQSPSTTNERKALRERLHGCGVCLAQYTDNPSR